MAENPVVLLADAARALHGRADRVGAVQWAIESLQAFTGASFGAFVTVEDDGAFVEMLSGDAPRDLGQLIDMAVRLGGAEGGALVTVTVPSADGNRHGVVLLGDVPPASYDEATRITVLAVAAHLGVALDNLATVTRLTEREALQREMVHGLQEAVRPPVPSVDGVELGVHYLPADPSAPTGGDLYDWVVLPDGDLHLAVVDVVGKGVGATKEALSVTHALRLLAFEGYPLTRLVARAGELVTAQSPEVVATVVVARYRPATGALRIAGGGHPPPLIVSAAGKVREIVAPGIPIGWPGAGSDKVARVTLGRSDALLLYTDGLIESTKDILEGLDALHAAAAETARYPAAHLARALVDRALRGAERRDDTLALVLRRRAPLGADAAPRLGPFEHWFSPNPATVPLARHLMADWLEHLVIDEDERADLLLVASELCSNAVRHSSGAPTSLVLRARADADAVVIEVEDDGRGFDSPLTATEELPDSSAEQGRGIYLARALTDELVAFRRDGHTVVRAVKHAVLAAS
jgi:serine phosphatase RsbU (regulator of sigma subunit)/anti-sigma regulatory factor (Ser/Thr protein kinase)